MNGPDSISDAVARRISYTGSWPSARLNLARRSSARGWWRGRWVPLCWRVCWLDADMACLLCMMTSSLHHADVIMGHAYCACWRHNYVIIIRVWHVSRVVWYSGRVSPSGRRRRVWRVARVCARGQSPRRRVTARAKVSDVRFRRGFQ
jgi:hypothetical protein